MINPLLAKTGASWRELVFLNMNIGSFLRTLPDFILIALVIFMTVRAWERLKRQEALAQPQPQPDAYLLAQQRLTEAWERLAQVMESSPR